MRSSFTKQSFGKLIGLLLLLAMPMFLQAQNKPVQKEYSGAEATKIVPEASFVKEGKNTRFPARVTIKEGQRVSEKSFPSWYRSAFKADSKLDFQAGKSNQDQQGTTHQRYVQTHQGIAVDMGWLIVHSKGGQVQSFNGFVAEVGAVSTTPGLSEAQALVMAKKIVGAERYKWEDPNEEAVLKKLKKDPGATYFPKGTLVLVNENEGNAGASNYVLTWKFDIRETASVLDQTVYVHASTGQKIKSLPLVINCDPGIAATTWNGNQLIQTDFDGANYILFDDCPGHGTISTVAEAGLTEYTDADNVWNAAGQTGPATTHYHARVTMDYYNTIHGRDSYDDAGGGIQLRHRANLANAFSAGGGVIIIGANALDARYYNTLDVVAHEFTHEVIDFEAALVYQGEPGALNESFADILGETCERWNENNQNIDWLHREDYFNGNNRSFINPKDKGDPDTYAGDNWANTCGGCGDNGGVHTNSGVQNHWFYLLTDGGTDTNDNGANFFVGGLGITKSRTITYANLTTQLGVNSDYADARDGAIAAAANLYGACSNEVIQVKNAWYAVGVGTPGMPKFNNSYNEPTGCTGIAYAISLQGKMIANPAGATYTWTANYNGMTGGAGNCNGGCGATINETLVNNSGSSKTVVYTVTPTYDGCAGPTFTVSKVIEGLLAGKTITASAMYCQDDPGPVIGLSDSDVGVSYQLQTNANANVGAAVAGTGNAIYFGSHANGTYKVVATDGTCTETATATVNGTKGTCTIQFPNFCASCDVGGRTPVTIKTNAPAGQNWTVKAVTGLYTAVNPYPQIMVGDPMSFIGGGMHILDASKITTNGFWVQVTNGFTDLDIQVGNPSW